MLILLQRLCRPRRGSVVLLLSSLAPPSQFASCSLSASQKGWGRGGLGQVGSYSADTVLSWLCVLWFFWRHLLNQVISTSLTETVPQLLLVTPSPPKVPVLVVPLQKLPEGPLALAAAFLGRGLFQWQQADVFTLGSIFVFHRPSIGGGFSGGFSCLRTEPSVMRLLCPPTSGST